MKTIKSIALKSILPIVIIVLCAANFNLDRTQIIASANLQTPDGNHLPSCSNIAFKEGEVLTYRMHYGIINAGMAVLEVKPDLLNINGRKVYHIVGNGYTTGTADWFFKVRDRYETYMDAEGVFPWIFIRRVNEGGFIINQDYSFLQHKNKVDNGAGKTFDSPDMVQDMISSFYYARTLDFQNAKPGDIFTIPMFYDDTNFPLKIKFAGRETINVRAGKFRCLKFVPVVEKGRIFKSEEDLTVWVTDDNNKIPLLAKAKILIGSIKMEVVEYTNLASPISKVK